MIRLTIIFYFLFLFSKSFCQTFTFNFTGVQQQWTVPAGVTSVTFVVAGAKGGGANGGNGATITKNCYSVTPGQILYIRVGGMGSQGSNSGGWNGGGTGHNSTGSATYRSWGGGGASDIRIGGTALANRVIVAGGGGGRGGGSSPVCGGAANCNNGAAGCNTFGIAGGGGTQTAGGNGGTPWAGTPPGGSPGTLGQGGQGGYWQTASGGGGGGGFYGGGGGGNDGCCTGANGGGGGGGGSSLVPAGGTCAAGGNANNGFITITVSTLPGITATNTGPYCPGQTIQLNATGGGTYSWSGPNGFTSNIQNPTIPNLTAANVGTYTVTVTNSGCSATATTTVALNTNPTVNLTPTNTACASASNGSINVVANTGNPGYNVSWTGPSTGNPAGTEITTNGGNYLIPSLLSGTYTITVTGLNLCTTSATTTINANPSVTGSATFIAPLCNLASDGTINVTASNGVAPYQVSWTGPATGNPAGDEIATSGGNFTISSVPSGTYNITLTDAVGCLFSFTSDVTQPALLVAAATNSSALCSGGATGTVTGTATGGTSPYDMSWVGPNTGNPAGTEINNDGGAYTVNGAPAGSYTLTMTDANGCTATTTTNLAQPLPLSASTTNTPALCNGSADGTITVTATDGTAGYNVSWTGPVNGDPAGTEISSSGGNYTITGVSNGSYTITITDLNGCTTTTTSTISQPVSLTASATNTAALCNGSADGTITVTSTNGTPAYNVSWTGPVNGDPAGTEIGTSGGNYTITGASAGTYTITVTDFNGCIATVTSTIIEPTVLSASSVNSSVLCNGGTTGIVSGTATDGTAPYDMSWTGPLSGDPVGNEISNSGGTFTVNNAPAGSYTIIMTDANGCVATTTTTITEPALLSAAAINTSTLCNGSSDGTVTGTATGGTAPYDMSWVGPNTGNPAGTEINTDGGSYTVNGAPSGAYTLTMTDANGCLATALTNLTQPLGIVLSATSTPPLCNGATNGIISINATGGTAGYDLSWSGPTSDNPTGLEISIDGGSYLISNLSAGTYTVTAIDQNGCSDSIISTLIPPPSLTFLATPTAILCNGGNGSVLITASNGTPGYDVSWTGTMSGNPNGTEINASGGTYTIPALIAGSYQLTVTDQNGCIDTSSVVIIEPTLIQASSIETTTLCQNSTDGTTQITVSGGIAPYNIILTGNAIFNPLGDEITGIGGNYTFNNLATGNYTANITDANNCNSTLSIVIIAGNILPVITLVGDTICTGQSTTLSASATPVGGTFLWGNGTSNSSITISPIVTTPYAVLYNYSGCLAQLTVSVVVNPIPTVSVTNAIICEGQSATLTAASLQPAGGSLLWSTGEITPSISVSPSSNTTYTVVYTLNGCSSPQASATVTVNPVPQTTINNATICNGDATTLTATPDLPGGTFQWSPNGETTSIISVNPSVTTSYSAVYTLNGCPSNSVSGLVTVNPIPSVSFAGSNLQGCAPLSTTMWNSSTFATQSTLTQWYVDGNPIIVGDTVSFPFVNAGCYNITLEMTLNGCTGSQTYSDFVCVEGLPVANFTTDINSFSQPSQNVTFSNNSIGATQYIWNTGDGNTYTSEDLTHLFSNTGNGYTVWLTAISDLGCIDSTSVNLPFMEEIIYYIPNSFTPDGDEFNNIFTPIFTSGIDIHTFEMSIFNRWGEMVFETKDPLVGWDGSYGNQGLDVQSGVYTYKISFKTPQFDDRREILGHVNVVR